MKFLIGLIQIASKYTICILLTAMLLSCGAATGDRYSKVNSNGNSNVSLDSNKYSVNNISEKVIEGNDVDSNFDFTRYSSVIVIDTTQPKSVNQTDQKDEIWFGYNQDKISDRDSLTKMKSQGYRVQVLVTDDLDEANKVKSEIYFITNQKYVYISFEPPFYKVKVGDYLQMSDANNLQFKLNQLGFSESKVISDEVYIYQ